MKLADVIASTYFTTHERRGSLGGARMIDVRQTTIYHYASPVAYSRHVLRLTPIDRRDSAFATVGYRPAPDRGGASHFFGNRMTWIELDQPHDTLASGSRRGSRSRARPRRGRAARRHGKRFAMRRSHPPICRRTRPRTTCSPAGRFRSIRKSVLTAESFSPGRPVLEGAVDLMRRIKTDFVYEAGVTGDDDSTDVVRPAARRLPGLRSS